MGSEELAANLFRATQTDSKLRRDRISNKDSANKTHREIGEKIRKTIAEFGNTILIVMMYNIKAKTAASCSICGRREDDYNDIFKKFFRVYSEFSSSLFLGCFVEKTDLFFGDGVAVNNNI